MFAADSNCQVFCYFFWGIFRFCPLTVRLWVSPGLHLLFRYFALHFMTDSNKGRKHILALTSLDAARFLDFLACVRFNLFFCVPKSSIEALGRSPLHCAAAKGHHLVATRICETKTSDRFTGEKWSENGSCIGGIKQCNFLTFFNDLLHVMTPEWSCESSS